MSNLVTQAHRITADARAEASKLPTEGGAHLSYRAPGEALKLSAEAEIFIDDTAHELAHLFEFGVDTNA